MHRREFMKSTAAVGLASLLPQSKAFGQAISGIADVHTHIFNIRDLPWRTFIWNVIAKQHESLEEFEEREQGAPDYLAGILAVLTHQFANSTSDTAAQELETLSYDTRSDFSERVDQFEEKYVELLSGALRQIYEEGASFLQRHTPGAERDSEIFSTEAEFDFSADLSSVASALVEEINNAVDAELQNIPEPDWFEIAKQVWSSRGALGRWLQFGAALLRNRHLNLTELAGRYHPEFAPTLLAPALVDFSGWLDEEPDSPFMDQIQLNHRLQLLTPSTVLAHHMVPFNPWRQLRFDWGKEREPSPLKQIEIAVEEYGALGVKVYPPMGFQPVHNEQDKLEFVPRAQEEFAQCATLRFGHSFASQIDSALERLYLLCSKMDIPILAHAHSGNEAGAGFGERARPQKWTPVFENSDFEGLRVCFAHFGGFDGKRQPDAPAKKSGDERKADVWEADIAAMLTEGHDGVFCDLSYLTAALPRHPEARKAEAIARVLKKMMSDTPALTQKIMFGSDWHMIAKEPGQEMYHKHVEDHLARANLANGDLMQIFTTNAIDFFGLREGQAAFERLYRYYDHNAQHKLDALHKLAGLRPQVF